MGNLPSESLEHFDDYALLDSVYSEGCPEPYVTEAYPVLAGLLKSAFESIGVLAFTFAKVVGSDSAPPSESWTDSSNSSFEEECQPRRKHTRTQSCPIDLAL
jgi:hypothetical protein